MPSIAVGRTGSSSLTLRPRCTIRQSGLIERCIVVTTASGMHPPLWTENFSEFRWDIERLIDASDCVAGRSGLRLGVREGSALGSGSSGSPAPSVAELAATADRRLFVAHAGSSDARDTKRVRPASRGAASLQLVWCFRRTCGTGTAAPLCRGMRPPDPDRTLRTTRSPLIQPPHRLAP